MIRTRHLEDGKISQTIDGKVVYRGRSWDFPVSPDSHRQNRKCPVCGGRMAEGLWEMCSPCEHDR